jgi:hypothetical protein
MNDLDNIPISDLKPSDLKVKDEGEGLISITKRNLSKHESKRILEEIGFDPLKKLVERHEELQGELQYQKDKRDGKVVELTSQGKTRAFVFDHLLGVHDRLLNIEMALVRYAYSRVPETQVLDTKQPLPLVINLSKKPN